VTALRDNQRRARTAGQARAALAALVLAAAVMPACSTRVPPIHAVLDRLPQATHPLPTRGDRAAAHLMEAALGNDARELKIALEQVRMTEPKLGPLAQDVVNATLDDPIAYRAAAKKLLAERDLHPLLESRLEEEVADDPLALANKRVFDHRHTLFARTFNALVEPVGTSLMSGTAMVP
jgi:hypothetical protein